MEQIRSGFLLPHQVEDRYTNMAMDEAMWQTVGEGRYAFLFRTYGWVDRPVVSLGYFQSAQGVQLAEELRGLPFVRRPTGGGAIIHQDQLTFAFAAHRALLGFPPAELTCRLHRSLADELIRKGVPVTCGSMPGQRGAERAFLCFERPDPAGLYVGGRRIAGTAQRRSRTAVLVHGVLELTDGLTEADGRELLLRAVRGLVGGLEVLPCERLQGVEALACRLREQKYATRRWNELR